jgi:redox-sensitive bicupin YhaK (pirin superfamily)
MVVAAHPHTGLQTMTWLFEGLVEHRDSVGSVQSITPGQLNLMTAGKGISHSELSQQGPSSMHAAQLWIALPDATRNVAPSFQHLAELPSLKLGGGASGTLLVGELLGLRSPAEVYTPLVAAELNLPAGSALTLDVDAGFEHGVLVVAGEALVNGERTAVTELSFASVGQQTLRLEAVGAEPLKVLMIGGAPFDEPIVMWWNFIARTNEEIVEMRRAWNSYEEADADGEFGEAQNGSKLFNTFDDRVGGWIPAPDLPNAVLRARV